MFEDSIRTAMWRKSSYSGGGGAGNGNCVEVATLRTGRVAFRDSKNRAGGVVLLTRAQADTWIDGIKTGRFDHRG